MRVVHWNISKENAPISGIKKYEDKLFENLNNIIKKENIDISLDRIMRANSKIVGSTIVSWILKYSSRYDIVHGTCNPVAPAILFKKVKKFCVTIHDLGCVIYPNKINDFTEKIQWLLLPKALRKADIIIAISKFTKSELINIYNIDDNKIKVIYLGVNTELYKPLDRSKCRQYFGLKEDKKYILYVASNLYHKRLDIAKAVFEQVKKCRDDVMLIKAGYSKKLSGKGIVNMGWIKEKDMPKLYSAADVYLHTSEYEGFGLPVLEAMACGLPIVASNKAAIPEVVGSAGYLVNLDDNCVDEFTEKVLKCLDREKLNKKGVERAREFSWERTAKETLKVYNELSPN